jgi:hypothetical protein
VTVSASRGTFRHVQNIARTHDHARLSRGEFFAYTEAV